MNTDDTRDDYDTGRTEPPRIFAFLRCYGDWRRRKDCKDLVGKIPLLI